MASLIHVDQNVRHSFYNVRNDIIKLSNQQIQILERLKQIEADIRVLRAPATVIQSKTLAAKFVATPDNKEFHVEHCILVRSTNPERTRVFYSAADAQEQGFEPCLCVSKN